MLPSPSILASGLRSRLRGRNGSTASLVSDAGQDDDGADVAALLAMESGRAYTPALYREGVEDGRTGGVAGLGRRIRGARYASRRRSRSALQSRSCASSPSASAELSKYRDAYRRKACFNGSQRQKQSNCGPPFPGGLVAECRRSIDPNDHPMPEPGAQQSPKRLGAERLAPGVCIPMLTSASASVGCGAPRRIHR